MDAPTVPEMNDILAIRRALASVALDADLFPPLVIVRPDRVEIDEGARIDSFVKIEGGQGVYIGKGVHIASFAHINIGAGQVVIADYAAVASGGRVLGGSNCKEGAAMSAAAPQHMQVIRRTLTTVGRCAFVGSGATLLPGVSVGDGAVIAAGAVVTHDVPPWEIWGGVPAQKIGYREH